MIIFQLVESFQVSLFSGFNFLSTCVNFLFDFFIKLSVSSISFKAWWVSLAGQTILLYICKDLARYTMFWMWQRCSLLDNFLSKLLLQNKSRCPTHTITYTKINMAGMRSSARSWENASLPIFWCFHCNPYWGATRKERKKTNWLNHFCQPVAQKTQMSLFLSATSVSTLHWIDEQWTNEGHHTLLISGT